MSNIPLKIAAEEKEASKHKASVIALILSNLVPLAGVFFLGWRVFPVLLLFSIENIVIGFYNVLRMAVSPCDLRKLRKQARGVSTKVGLILFFCVHYGMFSGGHLFFVITVFGFGALAGMPKGAPLSADDTWAMAAGVGSLFVSHGISFWRNFLASGEYKRVTVNQLFRRPYGRVIVMHLTIIFGAFGAIALGSGIFPLMLLIALKICVDLAAHLKERRKFEVPPAASSQINET
jgi:hypothetical protein